MIRRWIYDNLRVNNFFIRREIYLSKKYITFTLWYRQPIIRGPLLYSYLLFFWIWNYSFLTSQNFENIRKYILIYVMLLDDVFMWSKWGTVSWFIINNTSSDISHKQNSWYLKWNVGVVFTLKDFVVYMTCKTHYV